MCPLCLSSLATIIVAGVVSGGGLAHLKNLASLAAPQPANKKEK
jgi:hypothetical protein